MKRPTRSGHWTRLARSVTTKADFANIRVTRALLLLALFASGGDLHGQATGRLAWSAGPDLPSPRAECVALLAPDDAVLLLGGTGPGGSTVVPRRVNGAAGWTIAPSLDTTRRAPGAVRSPGGILVFGGGNGNEPTDEVLSYDYYGGDSQDMEKMSVGRDQFAFAADALGLAYAIGGRGAGGQILATVERYDPVADAWVGLAPLPGARHGAMAVGTATNGIYVFGGADQLGVRAETYRYTSGSGAWEPAAPLPVAVRQGAAVRFENRIYVIGGVSAAGPVGNVQVYDPATDRWSQDEPLPAPRYAHGAVVEASGRILVAGGYGAAGTVSASVYETQRLDVPETAPVFVSVPVTNASLDRPYAYSVSAVGNPAPTYSLISAPGGMAIDPVSGAIAWQPQEGQLGLQSVTVRAANRVGFVDQAFTVTVVSDTIAPTAPAEVHVVGVTGSTVELAWSGATDATGVDHYAIYRQYRCGFRGIRRCYALVQGDIPVPATTITGLAPLTTYTYAVRAFDAAGNQSTNSRLITFKTLSPPASLRYVGVTNLPANFPLQLQFLANANPAATFLLVSGPEGLAVDAESGVATWMPTPADVGVHALVVRATNTVGAAEISVSIHVRPDAPQLTVQYIAGAGGLRNAVAGAPWSAQVVDGSRTPSAFALGSAPPGMTIDAATGVLSWLPTPDDAGQKLVIVRAANAASTSEIRLEFYCHFTGPISNLLVTGLTDLAPTASWSAPAGPGSDRAAGYVIVATARYRSGRTYRTHQVTYETAADSPTVQLTGLVSGRTYTLVVSAIDEADHLGVASTPAVSFTPRPALPNLGWSITNASGGSAIIAGQEAIVQFTNLLVGFDPTTYSIVTAPAGLSLDAATGLARWTPTLADVGPVPITIRAVNQIGPRDVTVNLVVYFSGPVLNAVATRVGDVATAQWLPPSDNVFPVAGYRVTMHWQWGSRSYSRSMTTAGTTLPFGLVPTGAVWHKGVTIAPLDESGRVGVSTALIPYNGALPEGLPPADPAWIEQLALAPDGTPVVEVRGLPGVTVDVEVSDDLEIWGVAASVTVGENGVLQCPDTEGQNARRGFYRVVNAQ